MNVRAEIEKYSDEADKPILLWLFERYHWASQWGFVAHCEWVKDPGTTQGSHRKWMAQVEGAMLYEHAKLTAALEFYANAANWNEIETGIGTTPGPAIDYGAAAREALK